jgi:hypothetical protein
LIRWEKAITGLAVIQASGDLHISRQSYYQQWSWQVQRHEHEAQVLDFVRSERMIQPRIGTQKLQYMMRLNQLFIGHDHLLKAGYAATLSKQYGKRTSPICQNGSEKPLSVCSWMPIHAKFSVIMWMTTFALIQSNKHLKGR